MNGAAPIIRLKQIAYEYVGINDDSRSVGPAGLAHLALPEAYPTKASRPLFMGTGILCGTRSFRCHLRSNLANRFDS